MTRRLGYEPRHAVDIPRECRVGIHSREARGIGKCWEQMHFNLAFAKKAPVLELRGIVHGIHAYINYKNGRYMRAYMVRKIVAVDDVNAMGSFFIMSC